MPAGLRLFGHRQSRQSQRNYAFALLLSMAAVFVAGKETRVPVEARRLEEVGDGVSGEGGNSSVEARLLQQGNFSKTMPEDLATQYIVEQGGINPQECYPLQCASLRLVAGVNYTTYQIQVLQQEWVNAESARYNIVSSAMEYDEARIDGACRDSAYDARVAQEPWGDFRGTPTTPRFGILPPAQLLAEGGILQADEVLHFRMGGSYRVCYSNTGTFEPNEADLAPRPLIVAGVQDLSATCNTRNCLSHRNYNCYLRKQAFNTANGAYGLVTSCEVDFSYEGAEFWGNRGRLTWTSEFTVPFGYNSRTGRLVGYVGEAPCTTEPAEFICRTGGACDSGGAYLEMTVIATTPDGGKGKFKIPTVSKYLVGTTGVSALRPRTVAACYCPDRDGCDANADFIQQIGLLHYYVSKVCHVGDVNSDGSFACERDYSGVTGQYRFRVRVECPTDACGTDRENRIKLIAKDTINDIPSWDSRSGCRYGIHGRIYDVDALPRMYYELMDGTDAGDVNPKNCEGSLNCYLSGGARQDYKDFGGKFGFNWTLGYTTYEARTFHRTHLVDVCYCNRQCDLGTSWFKVGGFRLSPTRLVSSATSRSNLPAQWTIEYVNQPGTLGLYRPYADADVLGLDERSLLKVLKDEGRTVRDTDCGLEGWNSQLTEGLSDEVVASMNYMGMRQTQVPPDLQKIVFNSDSFTNHITVKDPGTVAICYCALTQDAVCADIENWKFVTHMTIKGPRINQQWQFSTNVVFRFEYLGFGLSGDDTVRIIGSDGSCTGNNYDPDTAAFQYTGIKVSCPVPCLAVETPSSAVPGDLDTLVLSSDTYDCSRLNGDCKVNDIRFVTVINEMWTELTFQNPHGLMDNEEITLGDNLICDPDDDVCTHEALAAVKGVYEFADFNDKNGLAPNTYMATHRVMTTDDPRKARIQIGWPQPAPKFKVFWAGARPGGYIGRGGQWTLHSRAVTREEIMGTSEASGLRVCWRYGGNGAKYVIELGNIAFRAPAPMYGAMMSMTTTLVNQMAPLILTFKTAGGVTGYRYDAAQGSLRLKVILTATDRVDMFYTTKEGLGGPIDVEADPLGTTAAIPDDVPNEDEIEDASQATCGKLFLELWSEDASRGFPLPKGCYYKTYPTQKRREIFLVFEPKTGLTKNTVYQMVFNGIVKDINVAPGQAVAELFPMDDMTLRPYEAIERGIVTTTSTPQQGGGGPVRDGGSGFGETSDPRFRVPGGFKIAGGYQNVVELKSGDTILFEMMGHATTGAITGGNHLRIYLWPLTQWKTTSSCSAKCEIGGEVSFLCDQIRLCRGVQLVPGMSLNALKITLPDRFDNLYGNRKVKIRVGSIAIPSGGFFAGRMGAQITKSDYDDRPFYVVTSGDFIWKEPDAGQPVSKVVATIGGGNEKPFRSDQGNVLYAQVLLSSTIRARDDTGLDASFTITLPPNYVCVNGNPLTSAAGDVLNAWETEDNLDVFRDIVPQGRGTPTDGTPMHGWTTDGNKCIFTPEHPNGVVYAGSSMFMRITVNNPPAALQRIDPTNIWTVSMTNKGEHIYRQTTQEYPFVSSGDTYYASAATVLGKITEASCQPTRFEVSGPRAVETELRFFFRTEQEVAAGGKVRIQAPVGFEWPDPCVAENLASAYYATAANPSDATLPLPGDLSCSHGTIKRKGVVYDTADITFSRILLGNRLFGFKVTVRNPNAYDEEHSQGWRIYTTDVVGALVDGTPNTVPFTSGDDSSWGVFQSDSVNVLIFVQDKRPFVMRVGEVEQRTYVMVRLPDVPAGDSGYIRFQAPPGYLFDFQDAEFVYLPANAAPPDQVSIIPPDIAHVFPPQIPLPRPAGGTATLIWAPANFQSNTKYFFAALVKVPAIPPTSESNVFTLEFGYNGTSDDRKVACQIPAPRVRALKNSRIGYSTNIEGMENLIEMQIETITNIYQGGGLEVVVPSGFVVPDPCEVVRVRDPDMPEPPSFSCRRVMDSNGRSVLRFGTGSGTLPAGLHAFGVLAENPRTPVLNYDLTATAGDYKACGTFVCFLFASYGRLSSSQFSSSSEPLDLDTSAPGFSIKTKMLEARIPSLTEVQRLGTGRDDRPMKSNSLIFAFKLQRDAFQPNTDVLIRAPYGFEFPEACLPGIQVDQVEVFGRGNPFPEYFAVWPEGVDVTFCRSTGVEARIVLTITPGKKLSADSLHVIRIDLMANPLRTPIPNRWQLEVGDESAEPIEGMTLWAFTRTTITPTTTAMDRTLAGQIRTMNPLTFQVRPFNTVPSGGEIRAEALPGFQWVSRPSRECDAELRELPYVSLGISYDGYTWPESGLVCLVDKDDPTKLVVRLRDERPVQAGLDYQLILMVYNPKVAQAQAIGTDPTLWKLSSYLSGEISLDESWIEGFRINAVTNLWYYKNPDPDDEAQEVRNGGTRLPAFALMMKFPTTVENGDDIRIVAPADFDLVGASGQCRGFRWVNPLDADSDTPDPAWPGPLPMSPPPECDTSSVLIKVRNEAAPIPRDAHLEFGLEIYNPLRTPDVSTNFWRVTHFGADGLIKSSNAFQSWDIIPQLEDVDISILPTATKTAAESVSSIRVAFTAVTSAEDLAIKFNSPIGFDFGNAVLLQNEQEIIVVDGPLIRIRMEINPGKRCIIDMDNVRFGLGGGQTDVDITTWVGGRFQGGDWLPGEKQDERVRFTGGFRLPGRVVTRLEKLYNIYKADPLNYPVLSQWEALMGRPAYAEFHFHVTRPAEIGDYLALEAVPYEPTMRYFLLQEASRTSSTGETQAGTERPVAAEVTSVTGGVMYIQIQEPLVPFRVYELVVSVIAPNPAEERTAGPIHWLIRTNDLGMLPSNTNDRGSRVFPIVEEYEFDVQVARAPPIADVVVALHVDPGISKPTELHVVAPFGFNFSYGCLISPAAEIMSCNPGEPMEDGRAVAILMVVEEGLLAKPQDLRIRVNTPAQTPVAPQWYIQGIDTNSGLQLGWGETPGFEIYPMADIFGLYPGIPGERARMVWRFRVQVLVQAGGWLEVALPFGVSIECDVGQLQAIALPLTGGCDRTEPRKAKIFLNTTIVPSEYAFAIYVTPPLSEPVKNEMSLILKDRNGEVRDGAVALPAPKIRDKLRIVSLPLRWSSSRPNRESIVTVGFVVVETLPDLLIAPNQQISEVLITLPVGFTHLVESTNDFTVMNEDMPFRQGTWLDFMEKDQLRVILDLNQSTSWLTLKEGTYSFRFPVMVPSPLPVFNVWTLSLCQPSFPNGCKRVSDPNVQVSFAMPGFALGQAMSSESSTPSAVGASVVGAAWRPSPAWGVNMLMLPLPFLGFFFIFFLGA